MFALKDYQVQALAALDAFFAKARLSGIDAAWRAGAPIQERDGQRWQANYDATSMGEVPAVCVRIPTGGGKTFVAAHAAARAGQVLQDTAAPVVLWLVPSDAVRSQTLAALERPRDPCREALTEHFGERVHVCALDDLPTVGTQEVGNSAIIIVATIQAFNVKDKSIRNVYAFDEAFAPHFQGVTSQQAERLNRVTPEDIAAQPYLTASDLGRVKASLANWLTLHQPIVVVDEAHNNRTEQAFRTLRELHPACVIEMTATPMPDSNVIFHVSAQTLANESILKLPIVLMEHATGWKDAVRDAILTRERMELLAAKEDDYIRPILLFQAQDVNGEANVETLLAHLTSADGEKLDGKQVAVVTGQQKGLDGISLADKTCSIRYVITVKALKEGWDCPFAYVLCSLQDMKSGKDVEQLLGRVLRMPYVRARKHPDLNRAYAHVISTSMVRAADLLIDRLINNMGFERFEAEFALAPTLFRVGDAGAPLPPVEAVFSLPEFPQHAIPKELAMVIEIRQTSTGATAIVRGELSAAIEEFLLTSCTPGKAQQTVQSAIDRERALQQARRCPAALGIPFAPVPQLCFLWEGELQLVESRALAELGEFDLFAEKVSLEGFAITESATTYEIYMHHEKLKKTSISSSQLHLNEVATRISENDLIRWLDRACRHAGISQPVLLKWLGAVVYHLLGDRRLSLTALERSKFQLAEAVRKEIERRRKAAEHAGFQKSLPEFIAAPVVADGFRFEFKFLPNRYPGRPPFYAGRYTFKKHYYGNIHDLKEKRADGSNAEEFTCAMAIDAHAAVKHWIRNVPNDRNFSFWLPVATGHFYPDFVAELNDGRLLVVEYKGKHLSNEESRHKDQVGQQWEGSSGGKCLFLMAVKDDRGRNVAKQIADKIATTVG